MDGGLASLITFGIFLLVNAVISLGHNAIMNARHTVLKGRADEGRRNAALALKLGEDASVLLNVYQISMIILRFFAAGIVAFGIAPPFATWLSDLGMTGGLAFAFAEFVALLLGAILMYMLAGQLPAAIGASRAESIAPFLARLMNVLVSVIRPLSWVLRGISEAVLRLLGVETHVHYITEEEIKTLVDAGQEEGVIEDEEKEMIYSIFQLADTSAREVMVPRLDMVAMRLDTPLNEVVKTVLAAGHSRIPVYEDNIDHIRGILYAKDLLKLWEKGGDGDALESLLRPAYFVPEGKAAMDLLQEMQQKRVHLAIIVDEYGGISGLVTLEDMIEEIIGEVRDEYDFNEKAAYTRVSDDEYICSARLDLDDLNYLLDISLPTDESDTLGGFIYSQVGEVPDPGVVIETDQVRLEVLSVDQRRIDQIRVTRLQSELAGDVS